MLRLLGPTVLQGSIEFRRAHTFARGHHGGIPEFGSIALPDGAVRAYESCPIRPVPSMTVVRRRRIRRRKMPLRPRRS